MNKTIFVTLMVIILAGTTGSAFAKSASSSGYSHGQDDCNGNHDDMYITGVNKNGESTGPDHHTTAFMNAYYQGWKDAGCSTQELNDRLYPEVYSDNTQVNTAIDDSNFDDHSQQQGNAAETVQTSNQRGECGQIVFGDCSIGQSNKQSNENTQANSAQND